MLGSSFALDHTLNGEGLALSAWSPNGRFLAAVGVLRTLRILDRNGHQIGSIELEDPGQPLSVGWDFSSERVVVLQRNSTSLLVFNVETLQREVLGGGGANNNPFRHVITFCAFSPTGPHLAAANVKGEIMLHDLREGTKKLITTASTECIVCGAWNPSGKFFTLCNESGFSISVDVNGALLPSYGLLCHAANGLSVLKYCAPFTPSAAEDTNLAVLTPLRRFNRSRFFLRIPLQETRPLSIDSCYGEVTCFDWCGESILLFGTSAGYVLCVSAQEGSVGLVVGAAQYHTGAVSALAYNRTVRKAASAAERTIRVFDLDVPKLYPAASQRYVLQENGEATMSELIASLSWSSDGTLLVASTTDGLIEVIKMIPRISADDSVEVLTSFVASEISESLDQHQNLPRQLTTPTDESTPVSGSNREHNETARTGDQAEVLTIFGVSEKPIAAHVMGKMWVKPPVSTAVSTPQRAEARLEREVAIKYLLYSGLASLVGGIGCFLSGWVLWVLGIGLGILPIIAGLISVRQRKNVCCCQSKVDYFELMWLFIAGGISTGLAVPVSGFVAWAHLTSCPCVYFNATYIGYVAIGMMLCSLVVCVSSFLAIPLCLRLDRSD